MQGKMLVLNLVLNTKNFGIVIYFQKFFLVAFSFKKKYKYFKRY